MRALLLLSLGLFAGCNCSTAGGPPTVRIVSPADWTYLDGTGPHPVSGEVSDPDELIQPEQVAWKSDRDGTVGRGAITTISLSPGEHRLTLEAVDRQGNVGSAQVSVYVRLGSSGDGGTFADAGVDDGGVNVDGGVNADGGMNDPVVTISAPMNASVFDEGQPISLVGSATDLEDGVIGGGSLVWTSDRAGVLGSGPRVTFSNAALGAHRIVLTATDSSGRTGVASITLSVVRPGTNRPPVVTITSPLNGAQLVLGMTGALQGSATDVEDGALTGTSLAWSSSLDGALGTGGSIAPALTQGVHVLTLTATDSMGATGQSAVTVSVNQANNRPPVATITQPATMATVFQGTTVTFAGTGLDPEDGALSGMALSWSSSRDGALGMGSPLTVSTLTAGDHTITLVVRDSGGNTGTATLLVRVLPQNQPPVVAITAPMNGTTIPSGSMVTFTGTATDTEDGALSGASVRWSSSRDGAFGTGLSLVTSSLSVGTHTITFTATDSGGRSASASISLVVTMSTMNVPPLARLTGPGSGQATDTLTFDGSTSTDTDGTVVSWRFDFGDGSMPVTSTMTTASHVYATAGTFTVTLTVTDDRGATATATLQVVITPFVRLPLVVLPAADDVGSACAIATPGSRVFLAWTSARHPGLFFGERVNGTLQVEVVDGLGFNTGGVIDQHVSMQVEANGTPHLVYVREGTVMYATKSGATWLRERVDATSPALTSNFSSSTEALTAPSLALSGSTVGVVYQTGSSGSVSPYRVVIALRTGANTWTRNVVTASVPTSSSDVYLYGELAVDGSGRWVFPAYDYSASPSPSQLVAWTSAAGRSSVAMANTLSSRTSLAVASPTRLYALGGFGVMDVAVAATFSSSTMQRSLVETFTTSQHAMAADAAGLPRLVVNHGSTLEVVRAMGAPGFWEWLELGPADSGLIDASVDGANETRACFVRAGKLMLY
ncbi:MAG: PKD domain-containing protein [Archangiaceae bacterium]|nr:PKD domain-containing protein [Archangiaceae bacterium]